MKTKKMEAVVEVVKDDYAEAPLPEVEVKVETVKHDTVAAWNPKTQVGKDVQSGRITNLDEILSTGKRILEPEIIDSLITVEKDLLLVGQSKGKFGGGKRRAWRQTQKKTMEGNVLTFSSMAIVGDRKGHVGIGLGKSKETLPSREKAVRTAKLNVIAVKRGCGHFDCSCSEPHSIPHVVEGRCGSVRIKLIPAPQGTGLVIGDECKKILKLAGISDIYSATKGQGRTTINAAKACMAALKQTGNLS
ncbi:MAG: 30S ribosomal protein S5 [Candidatus Pacearchaeota archaeon]